MLLLALLGLAVASILVFPTWLHPPLTEQELAGIRDPKDRVAAQDARRQRQNEARATRRDQAMWRLQLGLGPLDGDQPVFPSIRSGGWLRPNAVSTRFRTLTSRVNATRGAAGQPPLPETRLHDIRHSFATIGLDASADVRGVAARIGAFLDGAGDAVSGRG